jgi:DNA-binding CsgD family transcriptional regulator
MAGSQIGDERVAAGETAAAEEPTDGAPNDFARLLAELSRSSSDSGELVLDVELGGRRYTVVRHALHESGSEPPISARECEIARMVALGYTNKSIAAVLDISTWTVGTHLRRIYGKLGVHSRGAMVARLLQDGALRPVRSNPDWRRLWEAR